MTRPKLIPKVRSLGDLRQQAQQDPRYLKLAQIAASNLGGGESATLNDAMRWLELNATETGSEAGVVGEVNFCRDLVTP